MGNRFILRLLKCLKQTANERTFIQASTLKKCKALAKLSSKLQRFYLVMFRLKSAPSNRYFFLFLLYQTPVNKSESFNVRSEESESSNEAIFNLRVTRSSYSNYF